MFISFTKQQVLSLKEYSFVLSQLINFKWAQLLEKFNHSPRIASKVKDISDNTIKRSSLTKYKNILLKSNNYQAIDFYTGKVLQENDISVDHVIPWSFMYSDDIWNLVLTSKSNNSSKSNIIPSQDVIESLKERNARLVKLINDSKYKDELLLAIENDYVDKFYLAMKI
jgi:CRISPR/Cas system Type II protein with McrA/HNH and RuvC-like nuclease domain